MKTVIETTLIYIGFMIHAILPAHSHHTELATRMCSAKIVFLKILQNSLENNTCVRVSFLIKVQASSLQLIKKETPAQAFSYEFCEICKYTFFYRTPPVAASVRPKTAENVPFCKICTLGS